MFGTSCRIWWCIGGLVNIGTHDGTQVCGGSALAVINIKEGRGVLDP